LECPDIEPPEEKTAARMADGIGVLGVGSFKINKIAVFKYNKKNA
jgi:hypothetical protein